MPLLQQDQQQNPCTAPCTAQPRSSGRRHLSHHLFLPPGTSLSLEPFRSPRFTSPCTPGEARAGSQQLWLLRTGKTPAEAQQQQQQQVWGAPGRELGSGDQHCWHRDPRVLAQGGTVQCSQHGGKPCSWVGAKGDGAHLGLSPPASPGTAHLQGLTEKGLGYSKQGTGKEPVPREVTPHFGHPSPIPDFTLPWKGGRRDGRWDTDPTDPHNEHKHSLFPPHSCSKWASINPCPSPAALNAPGGSPLAMELGCNSGVTPILYPAGMWQCQWSHPAPWAHPLCSAQVVHHQGLFRWAHLQFWCRCTQVVATSIK